MGQRDRETLRWLWKVAGRQKWNILWLTLLQVIIGLSGVLFAWLIRGVINAAVGRQRDAFWRHAAALLLLTVLQLLVRAGIRFLSEYLRASLENKFKIRLFSVLLNRDYAAVTALHSGEWLNRLTSDTVVISEGVASIFPELLGMIVQLIGAAAMIFYLIPGIGAFIVPLGALLGLLAFGFRKVLKSLHKQIQEKDGSLRVFLSDRLSNLLVVRSFVMEQETIREATGRMAAHKDARMRRNHFSNFCNIGFGILMRGSYVAGAVVCGYGILNGTMSYGNLMAVLQLIGQVQAPFANISGYLPKYYAMLASAERLSYAETFPSEGAEKKSHHEIKAFYEREFQAIGMDGVSFSYERIAEGGEAGKAGAPPAILMSDVTFSVRKGEYLAVTGLSGSGKSTLLKLLMCLYRPEHGSVYIGQRNGRMEMVPEWRGFFAYVPQGNRLLCGSIREILSLGDQEKLQQTEKMWEALRISAADSFVRMLPAGLDSELGEQGAGLSEGQIQRIAIARAIMSEHPILLLDEATSSLDEKTERLVLERLRNMTDRTVILVTHRKSALSICDKEMYVENGRVVLKNLLDKS